MEFITENTITKYNGASIILGFFDGVHCGHREVIKTAVDFAKENNTKTVLITFKESPAEYFGKNIPNIYPRQYSYDIISDLGVNAIWELNFINFVNKSADEFLELLNKTFSPKSISTGFNHTFGANKKGNPDFLKQNQEKYGYKYFCSPEYKISGETVSSTRIRELLKDGNIEKANLFLKNNFTFTSEVIKGKQLGRELGFPTANMQYPENFVKIPYGVYEVRVFGRPAILNWGIKPTVNGKSEVLEVHIPDFHDDLYGKILSVEIIKKIREEKKFNNIEELKEQITKDIKCLEL